MRLTLDIDNSTNEKISRLLKLLCIMFPKKTIRADRSASGKGYHIFVYSIEVTAGELMAIRKMLGDDPLRIEHDNRRRGEAPTQVMFARKGWKNAKTMVVINARRDIPTLP